MTDILTRDEVVGLAWGDFCTEDVDRLLAHDAALRAALAAAERDRDALREVLSYLRAELTDGTTDGLTGESARSYVRSIDAVLARLAERAP